MDPIVTPSPSTPESTGRFGGIMRQLFGDDGMRFRDVLDLVNPLQHIPVVGHVYRELTGDEIAPAVQVAGGALFGGPLGAALSVASLVVERGRAAMAGDEQAPALTAPEAIADTAPAEAPRGGWLIAAASTGTLPPFVPLSPAAPGAAVAAATPAPAATQPRGGWMLGAASLPPPRAVPAASAAAVEARTGAPDALPTAARLSPAADAAPDIALRQHAERAFAMTLALANLDAPGRRLSALV